MRTRSIGAWAGLLRTIAAMTQPGEAELRGMQRACAARGMDEAWFLAWRVMGSAGAGSEIAEPAGELGIEGLLWKACLHGERVAEAALERLDASPIQRGSADAGALLPQGLHLAIEVWTETELASLHALWRVGGLRGRRDWQDRALEVAQWHLTRLQPDNATNRPWGAFLFAMLSAQQGNADAGLYAETLMHNCQVQNGRPDPLSALILLDGAEALESLNCS